MLFAERIITIILQHVTTVYIYPSEELDDIPAFTLFKRLVRYRPPAWPLRMKYYEHT